jgi:ABC-2 type transport system ATP-binding protein
MLRRVGIAQAIVNDPEILLLDEPTAGLDPEQRVTFRGLLRELGRDACVVVSTHLVEDVVAACEDAVLLDHGRLVFSGTIDELEAAAGPTDGEAAASPAERGYTALLRRFRNGTDA